MLTKSKEKELKIFDRTFCCCLCKGSASLNSPKNGDALPDLLIIISQLPLIITIIVTIILTWTFLNVDGIEIKGRGLTLHLFI